MIEITDIGVTRTQGGRDYQQDRYKVALPAEFSKDLDQDYAYFAVFDGHGGSQTSFHASETLHVILAERLQKGEEDHETAMIEAFKEEDRQLQKVLEGRSGSTAVVCLVNLHTGLLVVADVGDSHAVLAQKARGGKGCTTHRLSRVHKPNDRKEAKRIEEAGGRIHKVDGISRIGGVNMTRALGDFRYKQPVNQAPRGTNHMVDNALSEDPYTEVTGDFISPIPYVRTIHLGGTSCSILVLMSDGVCDDRREAKDLAETAMKMHCEGKKAKEIADELVGNATNHASADNATCIVVVMEGKRKDSVVDGTDYIRFED